MREVTGATRAVLLALTLLLVQDILAAPNWVRIGSYSSANGADATVFIDVNSVLRTGKLIRFWTMTDFTEFQLGEWVAPQGESRAYMSNRQLVVVDCRTKDMGYGSWTALDGRRGTGSPVHTVDRAVPTVATQPTAPGTIGEAIAEEGCKRAR